MLQYKWVLAASVILTVIIVFTGSVKVLQDRTQTQAIVKPAGRTVQMPATEDIRMVYVVAGPAAGLIPVRDKAATIAKIENWLKTAQPVSVQFPQEKNPANIVSNAYTGPAMLVLELSRKNNVEISSAYYIWGDSHDLNRLYRYVDGVIECQTGNQTVYFKDPAIYQWLKSGTWKSDFVFGSAKTPK